MSRIEKGRLIFCAAAGVSFLLSVYLWFGGQRMDGIFTAIWVPSILSLGALMLSGRGGR